jgi:hypothetical protein
MQHRQKIWRNRLIGKDIDYKRYVYYKYIQNRVGVSESTLQTIIADIPRTFAGETKVDSTYVQNLLIEYATVQSGDSYLQGFSYFMVILCTVFSGSEHAKADAFWCFSKIVGIIRPLMPDFNCNWFDWNRSFWINSLIKQIGQKRPLLAAIINEETEIFSSLILVKWYMLLFAQNIVFDEVITMWDFLLNLPPQKLMHAFNCIALVIIEQSADDLVYSCGGQPTPVISKLLNIQISNVSNLIQLVKKRFKS